MEAENILDPVPTESRFVWQPGQQSRREEKNAFYFNFEVLFQPPTIMAAFEGEIIAYLVSNRMIYLEKGVYLSAK